MSAAWYAFQLCLANPPHFYFSDGSSGGGEAGCSRLASRDAAAGREGFASPPSRGLRSPLLATDLRSWLVVSKAKLIILRVSLGVVWVLKLYLAFSTKQLSLDVWIKAQSDWDASHASSREDARLGNFGDIAGPVDGIAALCDRPLQPAPWQEVEGSILAG